MMDTHDRQWPKRARRGQLGNNINAAPDPGREAKLQEIAVERKCSLYEAINWLDYSRPYTVTRP